MKEKPNYFAILTADVRYDDSLKANEKLLYAEITALSNKNGFCNASNRYFSELYKVNKETVSYWIRSLKEKGYIHVEIERNNKNQITSRKIYLLQKNIIPITKNHNSPIMKNHKENNTSINNTSNNNIYIVEIEKIVNYLNEKSEKKYKHTTPKTQKYIRARLKEGFDFEDFKTVIDKKCKQWKNNSKMNRYLRPETLFSTKFEGYLNEEEEDQYETRRYSKYSYDDSKKEKLRKIKDPASL